MSVRCCATTSIMFHTSAFIGDKVIKTVQCHRLSQKVGEGEGGGGGGKRGATKWQTLFIHSFHSSYVNVLCTFCTSSCHPSLLGRKMHRVLTCYWPSRGGGRGAVNVRMHHRPKKACSQLPGRTTKPRRHQKSYTVRNGMRRQLAVLRGTICTVRYGAKRYSMMRYGTVRCRTVQYGAVRYVTIRYGAIRHGTIRDGAVR